MVHRLLDVFLLSYVVIISFLVDPIVGVDVSADSKYILTTCKTYILVIPTVNPEDKTKTGFDKSLGQNKVCFLLI